MANTRLRIPPPSFPDQSAIVPVRSSVANCLRLRGVQSPFPRSAEAKARSVDPNERTYRHCDRSGERVPGADIIGLFWR